MVFVVVSMKMKKDIVLVDFLKLKKVIVNVYVNHLILETLMNIVVVKKLSLTWLVLINSVITLGLVVNVLVTCRDLGMMRTILYIVVVFKVTNTSIGVYSLITLLLIDVKLIVYMILTLVLISVTKIIT